MRARFGVSFCPRPHAIDGRAPQGTYQSDVDVQPPLRQEPVQETPLRGHHVRVLFRLLRFHFGCAEGWAGVLARWHPVEPGGMRWRPELGGFLENRRFAFVACAGMAAGRGGEESTA